MAHIYSHCSLYSVHCCCPNTSHAKSSTHTEPLLSRWSFSSAQTTYEPHIENSVLLVPSRREVSLKKHNVFITSYIHFKPTLRVRGQPDFQWTEQNLWTCRSIWMYKIWDNGEVVVLFDCFTGWYDQGVNVWLVSASDITPLDRPQSVRWPSDAWCTQKWQALSEIDSSNLIGCFMVSVNRFNYEHD